MVDRDTSLPQRALALSVALLVVLVGLPMAATTLAAITGDLSTLNHLWETVLPRYLRVTAVLVVSVAAIAAVIGTATAWLVSAYDFRGRRLVEVALVLPLAFPAYVLAYAYTDLLDHPGPVQTALRAATGWGPRDYWFPEIRSTGGAIFVLSVVLYPYVYLLARAAFARQGGSTFLAARGLGLGPWAAFRRVSLPTARPAIAAGTLLVGMETLADFGTVSYFGVQTFATGIYQSWFSLADRSGAAQLALGLLAMTLALNALERRSRHAGRDVGERTGEPLPPVRLTGSRGAAALCACALPVLLGAVIPALHLVRMAGGAEQSLFSERYLGFLANSLTLASIAAGLTLAAAICLGYYRRLAPSAPRRRAIDIARLGYAVPGTVIAVGLLVPFAAFDNALDAAMRAWFGISTGLLVTGTIWLLVAAYVIRFLAAAIGAFETGEIRVTENIDAAARSLGHGPLGALWHVHLPLMAPGLASGALIVFVEVMKELPATLIMRPFDFDTLAVQAHRLAADERLDGAAVPSLAIAALGVLPVILLMARLRRS